MKKLLILLLCSILLTGCASTGVTQAEYDKVVSENADLGEKNKKLAEDIAAIKDEYAEYKEKMKEYEILSEQEAEARKIEADRILKEQEAEEERKAKEEQEKKEAEEKLGYETGITYEQLARTPDDYESKKVQFYGKVIQVMEGDSSIQIRFAVDSDYDKILLGEYYKNIVSGRILVDDVITIYGTSTGLITYQSTLGGNITIPSVFIDKIETPNGTAKNGQMGSAQTEAASYEQNLETVFRKGETAEYNGVQVTLTDYRESFGTNYYTPENGYMYMAVEFEVVNNTNKKIPLINASDFKAYADDYAMNFSYSAVSNNGGSQLDGEIAPGKRMKGWVGWEVPQGYKTIEVHFTDDVWKDSGIRFFIDAGF